MKWRGCAISDYVGQYVRFEMIEVFRNWVMYILLHEPFSAKQSFQSITNYRPHYKIIIMF